MQKITTFLTFKEKGEEAVNFYVSLFKNSKIMSITRSEMEGPIPKGALQHASFQLDGQEFMAMDGGPYFSFAQGFSLFVNCETQEEIDRLWEKLSEGGEEQMCGWVKDRYGVSWQIIPSILGELMTDKDAEKSKRVMDAFLKMKKFDIQGLRRAYEGKSS
ncbi:MAG TPA: VOC family protein [Anaerolineales bacterium]|nr:VOC family protein [Anaerolineales bacterium]